MARRGTNSAVREDQNDFSLDPDVAEAQRRFAACSRWEDDARQRWIEDYKFAEGDADNGYQWPNDLRRSRNTDARPSLTLNKVRQHNLQIINDAKQNKTGVAIKPVGNGATFEAAQMLEGVVRHIEVQSNAPTAYDIATEFQVKAGMGYWRVVTDYLGDEVFDQEIYIKPIMDPLGVYLDPDIKTRDGSDANFGFIFCAYNKAEFKKIHPEWAELADESPLGEGDYIWLTNDNIMVAEYFRRVRKDDELLSIVDENNQRVSLRASKLPKQLVVQLKADPNTVTRKTKTENIEHLLIVGQEVVERKPWPGKYIPIVRVVGEETVIEGQLDRKGHTRAMKDPQRMYNYWASSSVEYVALQGKTPWVAPAKAIEGYEPLWNTANKNNFSVLPYNAWDDEGNQIPAPQRPAPPTAADAYIKGMSIANEEIMSVSGQWQDQMGQRSNERSAKAINERQRQSDNATYHFVDNLSLAIRYTAVILLDLIPKIYDTERLIRIQGEDGEDYEMKIDPAAKQAHQIKMNEMQEVTQRILNPAIGMYDVVPDVGPSYATQRQQAWDAIAQILTTRPELTNVIGDLLFKNGDFPMADEIALRLKRLVPPEALGTGPGPREQALMQQVQMLQQLLSESITKQGMAELQKKSKDELRDIDAYEAETNRIRALVKPAETQPQGIEALVRQVVDQTLRTSLDPVLQANQPSLELMNPEKQFKLPLGDGGTPPINGARQAADGKWYLPDPSRPGKYLHVSPLNG